MSTKRRGEKSPAWKGGRHTDGRGYILIWDGIHRRGRLEHIIVWEQTHGKPLPKGWVVHHLNGVKDDNRPDNLQALPRSKHSVWTLVELSQKRIKALEKENASLRQLQFPLP